MLMIYRLHLIQSATLVLLDHITEPALIPAAQKVHDLGVPDIRRYRRLH